MLGAQIGKGAALQQPLAKPLRCASVAKLVLVLTVIQTFSTHRRMSITCSSSNDWRLSVVLHHLTCIILNLLPVQHAIAGLCISEGP